MAGTKVRQFNEICGYLAEYQKALGDPPPATWAEYIMSVLQRPKLKALALRTGAASLLTFAYEVLRKEGNAGIADDRLSYTADQYHGLRSAVESLLRREQVHNSAQLETRFVAFRDSARSVIEKASSKTGVEEGLIVSVDVPSTASADWPTVSLLWTQTEGLEKLIVDLGRQTGEQSWKEWFEAKFRAFSSSIPALAGMATWAGLAKLINMALGVGLIPICGTNIITFGGNLLVPVRALFAFPAFMVTQGILYDLHKYGEKVLRLPTDSRVMRAIRSAIDSIDWAAVQMAFQVTPAGLLITAYSTGKQIYTWAQPEKGRYARDAAALLAAAGIRDGNEQETKEGRLARMAIMALCRNYEEYIRIMTERIRDAESDLSSRMDA